MRNALLIFAALSLSTIACAAEQGEGEDFAESSEAIKDLYRFKVITHNIAGGMNGNGEAKALDNVDGDIADFHPDVVMLQEVCEVQANAFKARHQGWSVEYRTTRPIHPKCGPQGGPLGLLLASAQPFENVVEYDLGEPEPNGAKKYSLLCATMKVPNRKGDVRACSTHLVAAGDDRDANEIRRARQAKRVVDAVQPRLRKNEPVVMAGDFNAGPWRPLLDPIYRLSTSGGDGQGEFDEADQTDPKREKYVEHGVTCGPNACRSGENTHDNSKMDQIFFSHANIGGEISGDVRATGISDHHLYRGSAQLTLKKK